MDKKCAKCKKWKERKEFSKRETTDGLSHSCTECLSKEKEKYNEKQKKAREDYWATIF